METIGLRQKSHRLSEIKIMNAVEVAKRHLDAWNRQDADAIVSAFAEERF
jgi:hypothetical protein